jgi:hypothetical protein
MDAASTSVSTARPRPPFRFLILVAVAGCLLRAAFGLLYWQDRPLTRDEMEYLSLARSLTAGDGFTYDATMREGSVIPFGRAPGYPAFLAMVGGGRSVVTSVPSSVQIAQALVGGLGVLLIGLVAHRVSGPSGARWAAVLSAIHPPLAWIAAYALSEALFWPIGLACVLVYDRILESRSTRPLLPLVCGLLCGAGVLVRPALLVFVGLAGAVLVLGRRPGAAATMALGVALVLVPWTVRNHVVHDRLMLVASDGGVTFWTGNHPLATGEGDMAANPAIKLANQALRARYPALTEEEMEPIYYREALAWIRAHPVDALTLLAKKAFYTVVPIGPSYTLHSTRYVVASLVSYGALLALAFGGLMSLRGRAHLGRVAGMWLLLLSSVLVCLIFFPQERFRIPIVDPALIVLSSGLASRRRTSTAP